MVLQSLHVVNYALIDELEVQFSSGLNVITGETGTGKSIAVGAIAALVGGRVSADLVRAEADAALLEATFLVAPDSPAGVMLRDAELWEDDGSLIISREISRSGRHKARVNGRLVPVSFLSEVGGGLVEIHGQHENQVLLRPDRHIELLDAYGGDEIQTLKGQLAAYYRKASAAHRALETIASRAAERDRRLDLLRYQVEEIERAQLSPGEEEALEQESRRLLHAERLRNETGVAYGQLYAGGGDVPPVIDVLGQSLERLRSASRLDPELAAVVRLLEPALAHVQEAAHALRAYFESLPADSARLVEVESRLDLIRALLRKYGATIPDVLRTLSELRAELEELTHHEERAETLLADRARAVQAWQALAPQLTQLRQAAAGSLSTALAAELQLLGMPDARFEVALTPVPVADPELPVHPNGAERAEFLMSPNPGEPLKPIAKAASGGELSRVMLAMRSLLSAADDVPTLIFDEVDAGIGGRTAHAVGQRLARLGQNRQVVCVTHLAQVASFADLHWSVDKHTEGGRTRVRMQPLHDGNLRLAELARMLGGRETTVTLEHAREMVSLANAFKQAG